MKSLSQVILPTDTLDVTPKPRHISIIMDGNNRWAKQRDLTGIAGHKAGVEAVRAVLDGCRKHQIDVLTLFAFSSENWRRPRPEVRALLALLVRYLRNEVGQLHRDGVKLRFIGRRDRLGPRIVDLMTRSENLTQHNSVSTLVIAVDYGGQWDMVEAAKTLAKRLHAGELQYDQVDQQAFASALSTAGLPEPDLCIRTGGDARVSNFLLWQFAYTEFYFTETLWPDFTLETLEAALAEFARRERRFGGRSKPESLHA